MPDWKSGAIGRYATSPKMYRKGTRQVLYRLSYGTTIVGTGRNRTCAVLGSTLTPIFPHPLHLFNQLQLIV